MISRYPSGIYCGTRCTDRSTQGLGQLFNDLEVGRIAQAATAGDYYLGFGQIDLVAHFMQDFQDLGSINGQLGTLVQYDLPLDDWQTFAERVDKVTVDDCTEAAVKYINPDALTIVVVGDRAKIEAGLQALNLGEIELMN